MHRCGLLACTQAAFVAPKQSTRCWGHSGRSRCLAVPARLHKRCHTRLAVPARELWLVWVHARWQSRGRTHAVI